MNEQPKTAQLSPEEWKQLCLVNLTQLHGGITNMAPQLEGGNPGMNSEVIASIEAHLARFTSFLGAWARSRPVPLVQAAQSVPAQVNGATEPPRQKRKYTKRAKPEGAVV